MKFESVRYLSVMAEMEHLNRRHKEEIGDPSLELDVDHRWYVKADRDGNLVSVVARDDSGTLQGYAGFLIHPLLHYRGCIAATNTAVYLAPEVRGHALRFFKAVERILAERKVHRIFYHIKLHHDFSRVMHFLGYTDIEKVVYKVI